MERKIGIIGYGSMGKVLLSKFAQSKIVPESDLFIANRTFDKIKDLNEIHPKINICKDNVELAKNADVLFLCVKPFEIKPVLTETINVMKATCHIVSLNGSVLFKQMEMLCPNKEISKIIPSVTAEVNQSVTLLSHNNIVGAESKTYLNKLLGCLGTFVEIPETEIGVCTELTSCMPGFIAAIFKVISDEAEKHTSLDKSAVIKMLIETIYGTGKLLLEKEIPFDNLISRVATKGGITEEGTKIIEKRLPEIVDEIFEKTLEKSKLTTEKAQKEFVL
jgi:pyrroline-5-carboxylate reductase